MKNFVNENADFVATCAFSVPERRDLRFGSVHPKNRFLSLFLSLLAAAFPPLPMELTHSACRVPPARNVFFFEMIITSETFCFLLLSSPPFLPFLLFIGPVHCAPLEPHCLERNELLLLV